MSKRNRLRELQLDVLSWSNISLAVHEKVVNYIADFDESPPGTEEWDKYLLGIDALAKSYPRVLRAYADAMFAYEDAYHKVHR